MAVILIGVAATLMAFYLEHQNFKDKWVSPLNAAAKPPSPPAERLWVTTHVLTAAPRNPMDA